MGICRCRVVLAVVGRGVRLRIANRGDGADDRLAANQLHVQRTDDVFHTLADISVFAYTSRADEAAIPLRRYPAVDAWVSRVKAQERFLEAVHPYSIDPNSGGELP